ncbi:MAG TPA: HAD-IIIA family hydrolase [Saprospiraceae bacterium]|nr:HAD-IIIA family hydrolase [Saprospiraceae bacterium]
MNQLEHFRKITTFIFDVDGVLTNSQVLVLEDGKLLRSMNIRDGMAIKEAIRHGYRICVITGGKSKGVKIRLQNLGVQDIYLGQSDKMEAYEEYLYTYDIKAENVLYMGDDLPDLPVMKKVAIAACPQDAAPEIIGIANYVSGIIGGKGCARDVIEKVMRVQGKWQT